MLSINKPKFFKRNIENIVILAQERGIEVLIVSFATSQLFKDAVYTNTEEYIKGYKEMNEILELISQERNVSFFDFASLFPIEKRYYEDGIHVNEEGAKLKAKMFADFIDRNGLIN